MVKDDLFYLAGGGFNTMEYSARPDGIILAKEEVKV